MSIKDKFIDLGIDTLSSVTSMIGPVVVVIILILAAKLAHGWLQGLYSRVAQPKLESLKTPSSVDGVKELLVSRVLPIVITVAVTLVTLSVSSDVLNVDIVGNMISGVLGFIFGLLELAVFIVGAALAIAFGLSGQSWAAEWIKKLPTPKKKK